MPARVFPLLVALALLAGGTLTPAAPQATQSVANPSENLERGPEAPPPKPRSTTDTTEPERTSDSGHAATSRQGNPWGTDVVEVVVRSNSGPVTDEHRSAVRNAIAYWNEHGGAYSTYNVTFELAEDADSPDVVVTFVGAIDQCGRTDDRSVVTLACAPRYDAGTEAADPAPVRVRDGRSAEALETSVTHEFGHLLGLAHGEGPMPLMAERHSIEKRTAVRDATDRLNPWHTSTLTVAVLQDGTYDQQALRAHVREALSYYQRDPASWSGPAPNFEFVRDPSRADITLRVTHEDTCDLGGGYCWTISGEQLDQDEPLEYYTRFEASFGDLNSRYLSWYAGRVVGYALGAENESALPDTFRSPSAADPHWFDYETIRSGDGGATRSGVTEPTTGEAS